MKIRKISWLGSLLIVAYVVPGLVWTKGCWTNGLSAPWCDLELLALTLPWSWFVPSTWVYKDFPNLPTSTFFILAIIANLVLLYAIGKFVEHGARKLMNRK